MPKDETDRDDPLELNGAVVPCSEDNDEEMAVAFIEEFLMLDYEPSRLMDIFRDPNHVGPHRVYANKGEAWVAGLIAKTLEPWTQSS